MDKNDQALSFLALVVRRRFTPSNGLCNPLLFSTSTRELDSPTLNTSEKTEENDVDDSKKQEAKKREKIVSRFNISEDGLSMYHWLISHFLQEILCVQATAHPSSFFRGHRNAPEKQVVSLSSLEISPSIFPTAASSAQSNQLKQNMFSPWHSPFENELHDRPNNMPFSSVYKPISCGIIPPKLVQSSLGTIPKPTRRHTPKPNFISVPFITESLRRFFFNPHHINPQYNRTLLHKAIIFADLPLSLYLLQHTDVDPMAKDDLGNTALHYICTRSVFDRIPEYHAEKRKRATLT